MIDYLGQIIWLDEKGNQNIVPIQEYNFVYKNIELSDLEEGTLPKIDIYLFNEDYEIYVWTANEEQMFQIVEQIMFKFRPTNFDKYKLVNCKKNKTGVINEVIFKIVKSGVIGT